MAQTVLITGASRGIGRAAALRFIQEGWNVAAQYRTGEAEAKELEQEARRLGGNLLAFPADVADREQVQQLVEAAQRAFGRVDALVNNAGIAQQKLFSDLTEEDWDRMFDVNIKGIFHCCQAVLPGMIHRKAGSIVNLSSIWGIAGASCEVHYSASKAAVIGLTKALAKELGLSGIRVNCVAPGVVATQMNAHLSPEVLEELREETPLQTIGTPEDIADAIWFLASEQSRFITGQVLSPNGGIVI